MSTALEIKNLEVMYQGTIRALEDLSLEVPEGAIVALLGANGAGKTTTLKAISGFLPLENGRIVGGDIRIAGDSILKRAPHEIVRRGTFQVREGRHVFSTLTVEENLIAATFACKSARKKAEAFEEVYSYFPILKERCHQQAGFLSGGEQQMLAIGRALVAEPKLILLDEPSLGLAPMIVKSIFDIISRINREKGVTMLLVEQNSVVALKHSSYGYVIESGQKVLEGSSEELRNNSDIQRYYLGLDAEAASA